MRVDAISPPFILHPSPPVPCSLFPQSTMNPLKRTLICTAIALFSGALSSYFGGQISWLAHTHQCGDRPEGLLNAFCRVRQTPGAIWKGSSAGLWTGTILGAFLAGLVTRDEQKYGDLLTANDRNKSGVSLKLDWQTLERLTPEQMQVLQRCIAVIQAGENPEFRGDEGVGAIASHSDRLSMQQFVQWLTVTTQIEPETVSVSETQAIKLLRQCGFSETAIAAARATLTETAREN